MAEHFTIVPEESSQARWTTGQLLGAERIKLKDKSSNCGNDDPGPVCPIPPSSSNINLKCLCPSDGHWKSENIDEFLEKLRKLNDIFKNFYKLLVCNPKPQGEVSAEAEAAAAAKAAKAAKATECACTAKAAAEAALEAIAAAADASDSTEATDATAAVDAAEEALKAAEATLAYEAEASLVGCEVKEVEEGLTMQYPENFLTEELTCTQKVDFKRFCDVYLKPARSGYHPNMDELIDFRQTDKLALHSSLEKYLVKKLEISEITHESYDGKYFCSGDNLIEMLKNIKDMNDLKTHWGFDFIALPSEYDNVMKSNAFKDKLLYKIASENVSEKYPCSMYCSDQTLRFPTFTPKKSRGQVVQIPGNTIFSEFFSYNGWESGRRIRKDIQEDTDITVVAKLLGNSDTKRYFEFVYNDGTNTLNTTKGKELYLEINRFIVYEKIISDVSIKQFISKFRNILGNSISLRNKINSVLNANLIIKPMENLDQILDRILISNSNFTDESICINLGYHINAVAKQLNSFYGTSLGREIEFSGAKEQAKLIHKEISITSWDERIMIDGNSKFESMRDRARSFYTGPPYADNALCYAMGCQVDNIKTDDPNYKSQQRDISDEEEHIPPATKYQSLATLKFNTGNLNFKMLDFLKNLFTYLGFELGNALNHENIIKINNIILEEQSLLLLPSSRIYNQIKSSRDLITFEFDGGVLKAKLCFKAFEIIKKCIDEVIQTTNANSLQKFSSSDKSGTFENSGGCGNIGKIVITVVPVSAKPNTKLNSHKLEQNLNEWCKNFNNFSGTQFSGFNGSMTYGKLVHYISILYSFTLLTFMSHFYDKHYTEEHLGFSMYEPEKGYGTAAQYATEKQNWDKIVKKRNDPNEIMGKIDDTFNTIQTDNNQIYTMSRIALDGLRKAFVADPQSALDADPQPGGAKSFSSISVDDSCDCPKEPLCPVPECSPDPDSYSNTFLNGIVGSTEDPDPDFDSNSNTTHEGEIEGFSFISPRATGGGERGGTISKKSKKRK
jgi:hypothetical protein